MRMHSRVKRRYSVLLLGLVALAGCGGGDDGGGDCDPIAATLVARIEVAPSPATLSDGTQLQLAATAFSCNGSQLPTPTITWSSADAATVSVSATGMAEGIKVGGPVVISATAQGKTGTTRVTVVPRAVATVRVEPASATVAIGRTSTLVARAFDANGSELPGRTATWQSGSPDIATVSSTGGVTGVAAGGPATITATIEGISGTSQITVTTVAVATVEVSPSTVTLPSGSTQQLTATLRDDQGNVLTGRAVFWSTTDGTRASVSPTGLVTGLLPGGPVTIAATSEGRTGSSSVTVEVGPPARLAFVAQPSSAAAGAALAPPVTVEVLDAGGNRVVTATTTVSMAIGANPGSGTLGGDLVANAVNGLATFSSLSINRTGSGYTLQASANGLTGATSNAFDITTGPASRLAFDVQPSNVAAGGAIAPAIRVVVQDASGNTVISSSASVTLSLGANPGGATLGGDVTANAANGIATFSNVTLDRIGSGYTLVASSAALDGGTSEPFEVTPGAPAVLAFLDQPGTITAGGTMSPIRVEVRDALGNRVTGSTMTISMALGGNGVGVPLVGTSSVPAAAGVATFNDLSVNVAGTGYVLVASGGGLPDVASGAFDVAPGSASRLGFSSQPGNITENVPFSPVVTVEVLDALGNRVTSFVGNVSLQLRSETGGGAGSGNQLVGGGARGFVQGVANFVGMTVNFTGVVVLPRNFTLRPQGSISALPLSNVFTVSP